MCFYFCSRICSGDDSLRERDCPWMLWYPECAGVSEWSDVCCEGNLLMICPFLSSLPSQLAFVRTCLHSLIRFVLSLDVMLALLVLSSGSRLMAANSNNRVINVLFSYRSSCSSDYTEHNIHNVSSVFFVFFSPKLFIATVYVV